MTPAFAPIAPVCEGATITLPTTSTNGITGTWSPAINNTATTEYTFTPAAGQCAEEVKLTVAVTDKIIPAFAPIAPVCEGATITLPTTSTNGITGTWSPAINNTATTEYTFTPAAGQCAEEVKLTVAVTDKIIPAFAPIAPVCEGATITLPTTSTNGITGTWSPAINNTATTEYTFTPAAGQCAEEVKLTVAVTDKIIPAFAPIAPVCEGATITLPTTSTNGITGTWSPAINNTATTEYTFTPAAGQCAEEVKLTVAVTDKIIPAFAPIAPVCEGATITLPTTSTNGITGTWSPAINNTATTEYTFTPAAGQCAEEVKLTVAVTDKIIPAFAPIAPVCEGATITLPTTSTNGITGTWSPAINNTATTEYTFTPAAGQCAEEVKLTVAVTDKIIPAFAPIAPVCEGATITLPTTSTNGITGTWSPAINNTATTEYTFTPAAGQCAEEVKLTVAVTDKIIPAFAPIAPVCEGATITLPTTSTNGITGTWSPAINNTATTEYTFTPAAGQCAEEVKLTVAVTDKIIPAFAPIAPVCEGATITLPTTSTNGITGTWSPAINNTATTEYTFTPAAGQCAEEVKLTVAVTDKIIPAFAPIAPVCEGATITLPTTSTNGITGTWSPAINNTATTEYTFTPAAGQCAEEVKLTVAVTDKIIPAFAPIAPVCEGATITLPTTSTNGITGTWSPAINNTATTEYTFTPAAGQCAEEVKLTVAVTDKIIPAFAPIAPVCEGATITLPTTSTNGITGTWSPAINNTATTEYTFTPAAGQCAEEVKLTVAVTDKIIPAFAPIAPVCEGATITLPTTSTNGITGTWSPAINNTATTEYTFTPAAGQCAEEVKLTVAVTDKIIPAFAPIAPVCEGATITLPTTSTNGITGTWSPAINNTATTEYTFTPAAGQCAEEVKLTVAVTDKIIPAFAPIAPVCEGATITLPTTSTNGITGTWSPAINNTATTEYTFTPAAGQCAEEVKLTVAVTDKIIPAFAPIAPVCEGATITLPTTSTNGITGTWSPAINNTATTEYTFTPAAGQCAEEVKLTVAVTDKIIPAFAPIAPVCEGATITLPTTSTNGITGTWSPAINNTATTEYTFTPAAGQCAEEVKLTVAVTDKIIPAFAPIAPVCEGATITLPTTSTNGITGTWSPAINNTATTEYTFTPAAGQCAEEVKLTVAVTDKIIPAFAPIAPVCEGATITLPTTSTNGITGTWSPAINNTATTEYTFTPAAGQCAEEVKLTVAVTDKIIPAFAPIAPVCEGATITLPTTSTNGITGTWSPAINNTATTEYTFTPAAGQCAEEVKLTVAVTDKIIPAFAPIAPVCEGATITLPTTSTNGITGTWSPAINNTATTEYTFTPAAGQCAEEVKLTVAVTDKIIPAFAPIAPVCEGATITLPTTSTNGITGTWSPAINNTATTEYTFTPAAGQCAEEVKLTVAVTDKIIPAFAPIAPVCEGATITLPTTSTNGITGTWSPAINNTATTEYTFTPAAGQCAEEVKLTVAVTDKIIPAFAPIAPVCEGATITLPTTSTNGITGTWSPAINNTATTEYTFTPAAGQCAEEVKLTVAVTDKIIPAFAPIAPVCEGATITLPTTSTNGITGTWSPAINNTATTEYTFTPAAGQCAEEVKLTVAVTDKIIPAFAPIAPVCEGATITLPTTSTNGITGTWSPAINNTATTEYTFTPAAGQCAEEVKLTVAVTDKIIPAFAPIAPVCEGATITLPTTSTNGITGTWSPAINNTATTEYTFTPAAGQCAEEVKLTVAVTDKIIPAFAPIAPVCEGATITLPTTSTNGITGTWSPAINNTATTEYTFTPAAGQCAEEVKLTVAVTDKIIPAFAPIAPVCEGATITLPTTSTNGITGTWSPAINNTATTEYTFTPAAGQCAEEVKLTVAVTDKIIPAFAPIAPVCEGATITLPTTSTNGITGTWSPAINNTATTEYTFTPAAGQCAEEVKLTVAVTDKIIPAFAPIAPVCEGATITLPTTSTNGITGTWSPAINNTATTEYTFTPAAGQCAEEVKLTVAVTDKIIPAFAPIAPVCEGATITLPTTSTNGITGTWSPAINNTATTEYTFTPAAGQCAEEVKLTVAVTDKIIPAFAPIAPVCEGATITLPTTSTNGITGTWSPAINNTATTEYTFTPAAGQCAEEVKLTVAVTDKIIPAFAPIAPVCEGATITLPTTSTNGITGTWSPAINNTATTEYTFTPAAGQCAEEVKLTVAVTDKIIPAFAPIAPVCEGATITLPTTSTNGITGTWSPAINNTATTEYTFTPAAGQCAEEVKLTVAVTDKIIPAFAPIAPVCEGATITLPTTSTNGITGTWSPAINNTATTEYTFTPAAGQCAEEVKLTVAVTDKIIPAFAPIAPVCEGATITLPTTSTNGITGTWSPAINNTATTEYTFTPAAGQCAEEVKLTVAVTDKIIPAFAPIAPVCEGATITLPTTSTNGITGTWSPAINNTATTEYTFTPAAGQCAEEVKLTVAVTDKIIPAFAPIAPVCEGATITLPTTSTNGITGTWSPAINNTATTEYTFTPAAGQCAEEVKLTVAVTDKIIPAFAPIAPVCEGATITLPTTSTNGITGTWSPAINNTATTEYTFTPAAGQCAEEVKLTVAVTDKIIPAFAPIAPVCEGATITLPTTSTNGITGTWSPAINNTATTEYTFTPAAGQCAEEVKLTVAVTDKIIPAFAPIAPVCEGATITLPTTSTNGITGTWSPAINNTATTEYTFTPAAGQCAEEVKLTVAVTDKIIPAFAPIAPVCEGATITLPTTSTNGITGTWSPAINNTATTEYTFTPAAGQCAEEVKLTVAVTDKIIPAFAPIAPVCEGATITLPTTSTNGITGTWSPAINNTATTEYTFTPAAGQCAEEVKLTVAVTDKIIPAFAPIAPVCEGATITLPTTSTNGITGTWSPAINNTATTEYTFTPAAGQCAEEVKLTVAVTDKIIPAFAPIAPVCEGATITLPTTSTNGITGTWSPAINNTATTEYTFTPAAGQCAEEVKLTVAVTDKIIPAFAPIAPVCEGATITLPTTSTNGITGTWSPAINNTATTEYTFTPAAGQCAEEVKLTVAVTDKIIPAFAPIAPVCEGATITLPTTSTNGITGTWSPAINNTATTEYTFTPAAGQCAEEVKLTVAVTDKIIPAFAPIAPVCEGATITLPTTSTNGITGTWSPAINNTATTEYTFTPAAGQCAEEVKLTVAVTDKIIPAFAPIAPVCEGATITLPTTSTNGITGTWSPAINNTATTEYTFTPAAGQCAEEVKLTVAVTDKIIPAFAPIAPVCEGATITLPTTSTNGITGTWSPAINNTATTEYTFTPAAGQCAEEVKLTVAVTDKIIPAFAPIAPVCEGATITLPTTSTNGITGTWSPAINNTATTEYTFTPAAGQCAEEVKLTVAVTDKIIPAFAPIAPVCEGATITLPTTSTNGITGTWSPAINNTATTEYTFTPAAGQCAEEVKLTVAVTDKIIPAFAPIAPVCEGATITLPTTSTNGITGTWSPAINNTATTEYTFTPAAGQCAEEVKLTVAVTDKIIPAFAPIAPVCEGATITLPTTSTNGITGTWSPAINNTATTEYTFTPAAGQCAEEVKLTVAVTDKIIPAFAPIAPVCEGATITLPTTSTNGITGTWSPAINNTATTEYTFTPAAGQCAEEVKLTVAVTDKIIPAFAPIAPVCEGATITLPTTSTNGITGTWSPAINNTATTEYTFTPAAGQCAEEVKLTVAVTDKIIPAFAPIAPVCEGATITLPTTSTNGITGTWSPAINNTATTEYTFTPAAGQCAEEVKLTVAVTDKITQPLHR